MRNAAWGFGVVLGCCFGPLASADTLRARALKVEEAIPDMGLFADLMYIDHPMQDAEEWQTQDKDLQKQITELEKALKTNLTPSDEFDFREKLFGYYLDREVFVRHSLKTDYLQKWDQFLRGERNVEPNLDLTDAQNQILQAISHLRAIVGQNKTHPRLDRVVYELARNLCRINNENNRFYFTQFQRRFPDSEYKRHAEIAQADCFAEMHDETQAMAAYKGFLKDMAKDTSKSAELLKGYAAYRIAWLHFGKFAMSADPDKLVDMAMAERSFRASIQYSQGDSEDRAFLLHDEAMQDLAWFYALKGDEAGAKAYFSKIDQEPMMAYYFYRRGMNHAMSQNYAESIREFHNLTSKYEGFKFLPLAYIYMVEGFEKINGRDGMVQTLSRLAPLAEEDSVWQKAAKSDPFFVQESIKKIEYIVRQAALRYHDEATREKDKAILGMAGKIYEIYLKSFSEMDTSPDMRFNMASIYFQMERYPEAAQVFKSLWEALPATNHLKRDTIYNWVLSLMAEDKKLALKSPPLPANGVRPEPIDLPQIKADMIVAMGNFAKDFPEDEAAMPMRFSVIETYMEYGHYEPALESLDQIAQAKPDSEFGLHALKTILAFYGGHGNWTALREKTMEYLDNPKFLLPNTQQLLSESLTQAEREIQSRKAQK